MKTMQQLQEQMYRQWREAPKENGYPKLVARFPGVIMMVHSKEDHDKDIKFEITIWCIGMFGFAVSMLYLWLS